MNSRKYCNLESITHNSLKKYMEQATKVEQKITVTLPPKFALALAGWSRHCTHVIGISAVHPSAANAKGYETALLAFSPMSGQTSFTADDHYEFIQLVHDVFCDTLETVVPIIGDNFETYKALANRCQKPLIGCASHRFNIAVKRTKHAGPV